MMVGRSEMIDLFLASAGWPGADRVILAQDASFRRYERVSRAEEHAVLMDAPPKFEDVRPFMLISRTLRNLGYSVPAILAEDVGQGFLLLEDLGDDTYSRLLDAGTDPESLYELAVDVLIDMHSRPVADLLPSTVKTYNDALMKAEAGLMVDWYLPAVLRQELEEKAIASYYDIWSRLLPKAKILPDTLVLRDFHVDNLIRVSAREGIGACGLLDFQDAVKGPVSYDFVSLIEDARRDVADKLASAMRVRYLAAFPEIDAAAFDRSCAILGAQRHCKVLGVFTRLRDRDGKDVYLRHVPRLWRLLERAVTHQSLGELKRWLDEYVPVDRRIVPPERRAA